MRLAILFLSALALHAQTPGYDPESLLRLADRLHSSMDSGDWKEAAALSANLELAVRQARDAAISKASQDQITSIVDSLPDSTETLVVARQPFTISQSDPNAIPDSLTSARDFVLGLLESADDAKPFEAMGGATIRFAVLAARKFAIQPADGSDTMPLGFIAYQGCAVYAFASPIDPTVFSHSSIDSSGRQIWTLAGKQFMQPSGAKPRTETYWVTLLKPDVLLDCNNKDFFSSIVTRIASPSKSSIRNLPEWKQAEQSAPVWGLRHFGTDYSMTDPTNPAHPGMLGPGDPSATGIVMQVGLPAGKIQARWFSQSKENFWKDAVATPDFKGAASSSRIAEGVWGLSVNDEPGAGSFAVLVLMGWLGFIVIN